MSEDIEERVEYLESEFAAFRERVHAMTETPTDGGVGVAEKFDPQYEQPVIEALTPGAKLSEAALARFVKERTPISNPETVERRVETLLDYPEFSETSDDEYIYEG